MDRYMEQVERSKLHSSSFRMCKVFGPNCTCTVHDIPFEKKNSCLIEEQSRACTEARKAEHRVNASILRIRKKYEGCHAAGPAGA